MNEEFMFPQTENGPVTLQDENTSEAIIYGPAYSWIKNALWIWDEIEEYLRNKADSLESQIVDREWSYYVMLHNPYLINARSPPVNEVEHLKDLFTLRSLTKCEAAIGKVKEYRKQNIAWARMKGIEHYIKGMEGRGITESEWTAATAQFDMEPITFDYVHGDGPIGYAEEDVNYELAMLDILGPEEYSELRGRILGKVKEPETPAEVETEEPDLSFLDCLDGLFSSPVEEAKRMLETDGDLCSAAADYWFDMGADTRAIIDALITYAEG